MPLLIYTIPLETQFLFLQMGYEPPRDCQSIGCDNVIYPFHVIYNNDVLVYPYFQMVVIHL